MTNQEIELYVGKRNITTKYGKLCLQELHYYPANPRISSILLSYHGKKLDDEIIHKLMDEKQAEATRSLFQQVKKDGIINEPLIVYKNQVLEGNTRLWVAKELYSKATTKEEKQKWVTLPCRIIQEHLSEEEINHVLCNVHIKKKKDWSPFEQACYFARMKNEGLTLEQIKNILGNEFGINTIRTYIDVYKEMEKHKCEPGDWNRYYEAYNAKEVQDVHKSGKYNIIETIKKKTQEGKMGTAQDSRKLKKIVKSSRAMKAFFESDADVKRAYDIAIIENPEEGDPLLKRITELEEDIRLINIDKLNDIKKDKSKLEIIKKLAKQLEILCKNLNIK